MPTKSIPKPKPKVAPAPEAVAPPPSRLWRIENTAPAALAIILSLLICRKAWTDLDTTWDTWAYHLEFAALRAGIISPHSYQLSQWILAIYRGMPVMVEYMQGWAWRLTSHIEAANLIGFAGLLALTGLLSRWFRIAMPDLLISFLAIPVILIGSVSAYDDLWVNAAATALLMLAFGALIQPEEFTPSRVLAAFAAFAVAVNSKLQFIVPGSLGLAGLLGVLWLRRPKLVALRSAWQRSALPARAMFFAGCLILTGIGYANSVQNWMNFENPVYPVEVKVGPINWPGNFREVGHEPLYLSNAPQPARWLLSVLEFNAFEGRIPLWTNSQGDVRDTSDALRMGGFFAVYVALNLYWFAVLQRRLKARFGWAPSVFFGILTLVTAFLPASQELRYYSYWMLVLIGMNLVLSASLESSRAREEARRALLATAFACLLFVLSSSGGSYVRTQDKTPEGTIQQMGIDRQLDQMHLTPGETVCIFGKKPFTFLYSPLFNPALAARVPYNVIEGYTAPDCIGVRILR